MVRSVSLAQNSYNEENYRTSLGHASYQTSDLLLVSEPTILLLLQNSVSCSFRVFVLVPCPSKGIVVTKRVLWDSQLHVRDTHKQFHECMHAYARRGRHFQLLRNLNSIQSHILCINNISIIAYYGTENKMAV